jgi:3-phenylpropionate/trans-cinnamate dioxygenase ferredoxin subunit
MSDFVHVCKKSDIPEPGKRVFQVDDAFVLLCRIDGQFYALDDCCTHDDGPLGEGCLDGFAIVCPRHGARFDVRTGGALAMPATRATRSYEVRVEGEDVLVKVNP